MKGELLRTTVWALCVVTAAAAAAAENRYADRRHRATDYHRANPEDAAARWKRAYAAPWNGEHSEYQTFTKFSLWKPPMYQINGAYYIPVLGEPGKVPMYFAPQPFNPSNVYPTKRKPFVGPPYLPPHTTAAPTDEATTMKLASRFEFDDDDDRPVWNTIDREPAPAAAAPTRPPAPRQPPPPLVHRPNTIQLSAQDEEAIKAIFGDDSPPPRVVPSTPRTTTTTTTTTTPPPPARRPSGPSNCVWAVVSCCSAASSAYPERCFEQRGCPGPFWGASPCDTEFAKAAVEAALKFYDQTPEKDSEGPPKSCICLHNTKLTSSAKWKDLPAKDLRQSGEQYRPVERPSVLHESCPIGPSKFRDRTRKDEDERSARCPFQGLMCREAVAQPGGRIATAGDILRGLLEGSWRDDAGFVGSFGILLIEKQPSRKSCKSLDSHTASTKSLLTTHTVHVHRFDMHAKGIDTAVVPDNKIFWIFRYRRYLHILILDTMLVLCALIAAYSTPALATAAPRPPPPDDDQMMRQGMMIGPPMMPPPRPMMTPGVIPMGPPMFQPMPPPPMMGINPALEEMNPDLDSEVISVVIHHNFHKEDCYQDTQYNEMGACQGDYRVIAWHHGRCVVRPYGGCHPTRNNFKSYLECLTTAGLVCGDIGGGLSDSLKDFLASWCPISLVCKMLGLMSVNGQGIRESEVQRLFSTIRPY
ncbi:unnamed protein product [Phyllotreta striolata]|uniref:Uncharacterized protein n=1 Tax=Phyllotreta striolata TaxID=444603 RepID=A0A9N9TP17_PHYSR|nr:unnamed protein product [Phyllotreta striolata]